MTEPYLSIQTQVLAEAFKELGIDSDDKVVEVSRSLVNELINSILDTEPVCDHSVGICACNAQDVLHSLYLCLEGMKVCPRCGGDGFDWVDDEQRNCGRCAGRGKVPFPKSE